MNIGGVEKSFLTLSDQLIDKGNKVTIVTLNQNKNSLNQNDRIEIISLNTSRSILSLFKLSKMLNEKKPDILISAQYYANIVAILSSVISKYKPKTILSERLHLSSTLKQYNLLKKLLLKFLVKMTYRNADLIYGNSDSVCEDLKKNYINESGKVIKILNPSSSKNIIKLSEEEVDDTWISKSSEPIILYVGRLSFQKDIPTLLKTFEIITNELNSKLLIVGDGPQRKLVEEFKFNNPEIGNQIKLIGYSKNHYKFFKYSKVFLLTSLYEGIPNVLIESQILGTPIVATNSPGGTTEVLEGGRSGLLANVKDIQELSEKTLRILKEENISKELKENMDFSARRFEPSIVTEYLISEIKKLFNN